MTAKQEAYIKKTFPLIAKITDADMRDKVVKAWIRVWDESGHASPDIVLMKGHKQDTLVTHTNSVTNGALALATQLKEEYGLKIRFDILLAAALLHDVDKMLVYEKEGGFVKHNEFGKKIRHGIYGGYVALAVGLPIDVVHIILNHANEDWNTIEGILLFHADAAKIHAVHQSLGGKPREQEKRE